VAELRNARIQEGRGGESRGLTRAMRLLAFTFASGRSRFAEETV
jgi:hypothetical protein